MSNALTMFDANHLPAHVASFFEEESNIADRVTVPSLGYEGKVWTIALNGDKTKLVKKDADGDEVPVPVMRVVVLDYAKRRGRALYEGAYDPAKPGTPSCWSDDGVTPNASVKEPQHAKCDGCPMAVKGSKVTENGKAVTACSQHRMLAVVPANKLDYPPLRLKLAITSDYDGQSPELEAQGWYAFSNYTDFLRAKGVQHTAALVTKMKFDPNVAYPKVLFSPDKWLDDAALKTIAPVAKSDGVKALLAGTWTPAGVDGVPIKQELVSAPDDRTGVAAGLVKQAEEARKKTDAAKAAIAAEADAKAKKVAVAKKAAEAAKKKLAPADDDEDAIILPGVDASPREAAAKLVTPPPAVNDIPDDVADLLAEWGE